MSGRTAMGLVGLLVGCGSLAEQGYVGEPLAVLEGEVLSAGPNDPFGSLGFDQDAEQRVALFWAIDGEVATEQTVEVSTSFPARYRLEVFQPPPEEALLDVPWVEGGRVALAMPLLYLDSDGDGQLGESEALVGNALGMHLLYSETSSRYSSGGFDLQLQQGFERVYASSSECAGGVPPLQSVPEAEPTYLFVGPAFARLIDVNCDGSTDDEWELCPTGDELRQWCMYAAQAEDFSDPCLEDCFGGPWR